jgi:hypothetical protein
MEPQNFREMLGYKQEAPMEPIAGIHFSIGFLCPVAGVCLKAFV